MTGSLLLHCERIPGVGKKEQGNYFKLTRNNCDLSLKCDGVGSIENIGEELEQ